MSILSNDSGDAFVDSLAPSVFHGVEIKHQPDVVFYGVHRRRSESQSQMKSLLRKWTLEYDYHYLKYCWYGSGNMNGAGGYYVFVIS